ncbi:hypothetical protein EVAR_48963_1 [Eumeta japonica]|uniref:Uncharacterized protein n=1 Tax=Eumeta variegata TaxID=151549 RepID=A0A4C1Y939_EUMVA|nr:hypothetical protein EVAR_48963_1 [Eumeta japonica]
MIPHPRVTLPTGTRGQYAFRTAAYNAAGSLPIVELTDELHFLGLFGARLPEGLLHGRRPPVRCGGRSRQRGPAERRYRYYYATDYVVSKKKETEEKPGQWRHEHRSEMSFQRKIFECCSTPYKRGVDSRKPISHIRFGGRSARLINSDDVIRRAHDSREMREARELNAT